MTNKFLHKLKKKKSCEHLKQWRVTHTHYIAEEGGIWAFDIVLVRNDKDWTSVGLDPLLWETKLILEMLLSLVMKWLLQLLWGVYKVYVNKSQGYFQR